MTTPSSLLEELEQTASSVASAVLPATVSIGKDHRGAGVVVGAGKVLTNAHNLNARTTQVTFGDGRVVQASLVGADRAGDLAVLDCDTADVTPLPIADASPDLGAIVFAGGRGGSGERLSPGSVTGVDRSFRGPGGHAITGAIEHSAPLGRGSSGGPLVDRSGSLVGVNTHRRGSRFYLSVGAGSDLADRVARLGAGEEPPSRRLGIALAPPEVAAQLRRAVGLSPRDGVLVRGVQPGSAAAQAGLREGDLIVSVGDVAVTDPAQLVELVGSHDVTDALHLTVVRGEDEVAVQVRLDGDGPAEEGSA